MSLVLAEGQSTNRRFIRPPLFGEYDIACLIDNTRAHRCIGMTNVLRNRSATIEWPMPGFGTEDGKDKQATATGIAEASKRERRYGYP